MLYRFTGETPEFFPTVVVTTVDGQPRESVLQPGDEVNVVSVDGDDSGVVIHRRLQPADEATGKATDELVAWVRAVDEELGRRTNPAAATGHSESPARTSAVTHDASPDQPTKEGD